MYTSNDQRAEQEVQLSVTFKILRLCINFENDNCCGSIPPMNLLLALSFTAQVTGPASTDTELLCIIAAFKNCAALIVSMSCW